MYLFASPRQRGRARQLLCATLLLLLVVASAPADVIISGSSGSTTSSAFTDFGGSNSQTNSFSGLGSRSSSASASDGFGSASTTGSVSIGLSGTPNGVQTLTGHAASSGLSGGSSESFGTSNLSGTMALTPAGGVNTEYRFQLTANGTASQTWNNDASAGFNIAGVGGNSVTANDFLTSDTKSFSMSASGILVPGVFPFSAFANQDNFENGPFTGATNASVNFSLLLTPIPEPGTVAALGLGVLSLAGYGWLRRWRVAPI